VSLLILKTAAKGIWVKNKERKNKLTLERRGIEGRTPIPFDEGTKYTTMNTRCKRKELGQVKVGKGERLPDKTSNASTVLKGAEERVPERNGGGERPDLPRAGWKKKKTGQACNGSSKGGQKVSAFQPCGEMKART